MFEIAFIERWCPNGCPSISVSSQSQPSKWTCRGALLGMVVLGLRSLFGHVAGACRWGLAGPYFLAQRFNEHVCQLCPALKDSQLFNDNSAPVVIQAGAGEASVCRHYVYVDNIGALGPHAAYAKNVQELAKKFDSVGLLTHGDEVLEGVGDVLGNSVNCSLLQSGFRPARGIVSFRPSSVYFVAGGWQAGWLRSYWGNALLRG